MAAAMAEMIRTKLAEQGRKQTWLAERSGASTKHVNLVLNGKTGVDLKDAGVLG
jgi:hypothetical protein